MQTWDSHEFLADVRVVHVVLFCGEQICGFQIRRYNLYIYIYIYIVYIMYTYVFSKVHTIFLHEFDEFFETCEHGLSSALLVTCLSLARMNFTQPPVPLRVFPDVAVVAGEVGHWCMFRLQVDIGVCCSVSIATIWKHDFVSQKVKGSGFHLKNKSMFFCMKEVLHYTRLLVYFSTFSEKWPKRNDQNGTTWGVWLFIENKVLCTDKKWFSLNFPVQQKNLGLLLW